MTKRVGWDIKGQGKAHFLFFGFLLLTRFIIEN